MYKYAATFINNEKINLLINLIYKKAFINFLQIKMYIRNELLTLFLQFYAFHQEGIVKKVLISNLDWLLVKIKIQDMKLESH